MLKEIFLDYSDKQNDCCSYKALANEGRINILEH